MFQIPDSLLTKSADDEIQERRDSERAGYVNALSRRAEAGYLAHQVADHDEDRERTDHRKRASPVWPYDLIEQAANLFDNYFEKLLTFRRPVHGEAPSQQKY